MSESTYFCPDCGQRLKISLQVTIPDNEPDRSIIIFYCTGKCKKNQEPAEVPKKTLRPDLQGLTFAEKQDYLLELARSYVVDDNAIVERQRLISSFMLAGGPPAPREKAEVTA